MSFKVFVKYSVLCVLCLVSVSSCREEPVVPQDMTITVTAGFASDSSSAGSPFVDSTLYWQKGDRIKVFNGKNGVKCIGELGRPIGIAKFIGSSSTSFSPSADNPIFGLFPYQEDASCEGGVITARVAEKQTGQSGSFSRDANLFVAKSDSYSLSFRNVCSGIKFSLKNDNITEIVIKSQNGEPIAGRAKISFKGDVPVVESVTDGKDEISISLPDGKCFEAGKWYFISTLPCTLSYGISVKFYTADKFASKKIGDRMELGRGQFKSFDAFDGSTDAFGDDKLIFIESDGEIWNNKELSVRQRIMSLPDVVSVDENGVMIGEFGFIKKVMFRLPIDHNDPSKGYFLNEVEIGVLNPDSLNVIVFTGYSNFTTPHEIDYVTELVNGNQFKIEHRDFGSSSTNTGYAYLTTAQAAADQKQIIDNLKLMFHRRFAVTGASKGGMTTALLAGYCPELDMVYVPVVAPFCITPDDVKGHTFLLEKFMTEDIRTRMISLQRKMLALMDIPEVMDEFSKAYESANNRPDLSVKDAFYYQVQEFYPVFWQTVHDASKLPDSSLEGLQLWNAVKSYLMPEYSTDSFVFNIQSFRELGSLGFNHIFSDIYTPQRTDYCRAQVPAQCREDSFNSETYEKYIVNAVRKTERPMLFIYGENDVWTNWAIDDRLVNGTNVRKYIVPGGFHNSWIGSFKDESVRKEIDDWLLYYMYR